MENKSQRRVAGISRHLTNATVAAASIGPYPNTLTANGRKQVSDRDEASSNWVLFFALLNQYIKEKSPELMQQLEIVLKKLPSDLEDLEYDISKYLPGPLNDKQRFPNGWLDVFIHDRPYVVKGEPHVLIAEYQKYYGGKQGLSANIVIPQVLTGRIGPDDSGRFAIPLVSQEVIIANPEDARRIARMHVVKNPNFSQFFYNSIISTTDMEDWRAQREHLVGAFLPEASLSKIFPVTLNRARECAKRLETIRLDASKPEGAGVVNMNDFLLYETEAQLQLALFGMEPEFMENTNEKFRQSMAGKDDPLYARRFCRELLDEIHNHADIAGPVSKGVGSGCPVKGPLSDGLKTLDVKGRAEFGNAFIFAFAGHDTTGHTLTWLLYELAQNPSIQIRLQKEVDDFFTALGDRDMTYKDLASLPFMTKCIMETLRLWPAVANGTFRQIQFDDYIKGPNGEDVKIKKGTYVRIVNWSRHRNPDLWGADVDSFNPDRNFKPDELWNGDVLRAYNPHTDRFSPFTFTPRDCIGKNFAQMEMRAILCYLLRSYSFELTDETLKADKTKYLGVNYGTMAPRDMHGPSLIQSLPGFGPTVRRPTGLRMRPVPRGN